MKAMDISCALNVILPQNLLSLITFYFSKLKGKQNHMQFFNTHINSL